jgi:hypothetical protein
VLWQPACLRLAARLVAGTFGFHDIFRECGFFAPGIGARDDCEFRLELTKKGRRV